MPHDNTHLNHKLNVLQTEINDVNSKLNDFFTDLSRTAFRPNGNKLNHEKQTTNSWTALSLNMTTKMYQKSNTDELPDRIYVKRNSLLTEMFKISHIRTIRNIFTSIMIVLALQVVFDDLMNEGK